MATPYRYYAGQVFGNSGGARLVKVILGAALAAAVLIGGGQAASAATYYVAPNGNDGAAGMQGAPWKSFQKAQSVAAPGDTVYFRGGTYVYTKAETACPDQRTAVDAIAVSKSGVEGKPILYAAYPGEKPVFDFYQMKEDCRIKGFHVSADWVHLKGFEIRGVPQNNNLNHENWGVWVTGSHNVFEQLDIHHIMGAGFFLNNGAYNLVLNSDSHHNYDPLTSNGAGESGDGFGGHPKAGMPGNVFRGCRAWTNSDDGFDLINAWSSVLIENSWAWNNGYLPDGKTPSKNGNGFKMGGYGGRFNDTAVTHALHNSVAFDNRASGVYANHHPLSNDYFNNTAFNNGANFNMLGIDKDGKPIQVGKLRNNLAFGDRPNTNMSKDDASNSWTLPVTVTADDFEKVAMTGWDAPRQADGNLPVLPLMRLKAGSDLIDAGVDVGLPYKGKAPDLGAFEH
jgi:hypothetical protein